MLEYFLHTVNQCWTKEIFDFINQGLLALTTREWLKMFFCFQEFARTKHGLTHSAYLILAQMMTPVVFMEVINIMFLLSVCPFLIFV